MKYIKIIIPFLLLNIANAAAMTGVNIGGLLMIPLIALGFLCINPFIIAFFYHDESKISTFFAVLFLHLLVSVILIFHDFLIAFFIIGAISIVEFFGLIIGLVVIGKKTPILIPSPKQTNIDDNLVISFTERPIQNKKKNLKSSFF